MHKESNANTFQSSQLHDLTKLSEANLVWTEIQTLQKIKIKKKKSMKASFIFPYNKRGPSFHIYQSEEI